MANETDVLIVGSGPLGIATARRLAECGRSVLVLEQGPAITDPPGSHIRNAERFQTDPDAYLEVATKHLSFLNSDAPREALPGAAVTDLRGGQGIIWTNLCPRGDAPWDALSGSGWNDYYDLAEAYLGVQSEWFEGSARQQRIRAKLEPYLADEGRGIETLPVAARPIAGDRLHFTAPYDILAGSPNADRIRVAKATVDRLVVKAGRVAGAVIGNDILSANEVVIAAGAIGTPRLLHRSGIRPRALGRWLSYHPLLICQLVLDEALCAAPGAPDREPRLQIRPAGSAEWYTLLLRDVSPFHPEGEDVDTDPNRIVELQLICPVDPMEKNGIRFDEDSRPTFELPLSPADKARMSAAEAEADRLAGLLGRYRAGCMPIWMPFGFAHMTGTTRMGAVDDGTGVADYDGRVWGIENLYLATNGLIPTRMSVNPTLTGVALAIRVADRIASGA